MLSSTTRESICHSASGDDSSNERLKARVKNILLMQTPAFAWKVYESCMRSVDSQTLKSELLVTHTVGEFQYVPAHMAWTGLSGLLPIRISVA
jgi:hypothetical protein